MTDAIIKRDGFAAMEVTAQNETAASTMAAQAKAAVEARWIIAMRQPRDMDQVRTEILRDCDRPSFAETARYLKPIGKGVEGLSIRFVEAAISAMGNIDASATTVYDDNEKRIVEVVVTDFEKNVTHRKQITISKRVERSSLRQGQVPIDRRTNANGQTVYIVEATDDDLLNKEAALVSKAMRTCGLRLVPGWLQDESEQRIIATMQNAAAKDPDAERRRMVDAFATIGVAPKDLAEYLGHDIAKVSPSQLIELRQVYTTIKDGQATWVDTLAHRRGEEVKPVGKGKSAVAELIGGEK